MQISKSANSPPRLPVFGEAGETSPKGGPDFENLLEVLRGGVPRRSTLFEFFMNGPLYEKLAGKKLGKEGKDWKLGDLNEVIIEAFKNAGYDYVTCHGSEMAFVGGEVEKKATISLNAGGVISDRASFELYRWPEPESFDYSRLRAAEKVLPEGMKLIVFGPGGVLENVISLVGFERLCMLLTDEPSLVKEIFDAVGERLVRYYKICAGFDSVGALICNDDWGFKTSTMLSPQDMRRYVFGWHKKMVEVIHMAGKPAILHSCGNLDEVMEDIIEDMDFDAKHSFEDVILPVEEAYERWGGRIAVLGGIDVDFICRSSVEEIKERCEAMLARTAERGGYALGTGNSVPEYVPDDKYLAMISCVTTLRLGSQLR
jgi:uroporphyrinogen decarboxylase